jgi:hypothetical protein
MYCIFRVFFQALPQPNLGMFIVLVILLMALLAWACQAIQPPPPRICGSPSGPPVTAPRIKLRDGRHLAYKEHGVSKEVARFNVIYIHALQKYKYFDTCILTRVRRVSNVHDINCTIWHVYWDTRVKFYTCIVIHVSNTIHVSNRLTRVF